MLLNEGFDNLLTKFSVQVLKVYDRVRQLPHKFSPFVYMAERSPSTLPTTDNVVSNVVEEIGDWSAATLK